jgi:transposase
MCTLVAMRFNPDLKAAGKASKIAITAIMRKIIVLLNTLLRNRRNWTPSLL